MCLLFRSFDGNVEHGNGGATHGVVGEESLVGIAAIVFHAAGNHGGKEGLVTDRVREQPGRAAGVFAGCDGFALFGEGFGGVSAVQEGTCPQVANDGLVANFDGGAVDGGDREARGFAIEVGGAEQGEFVDVTRVHCDVGFEGGHGGVERLVSNEGSFTVNPRRHEQSEGSYQHDRAHHQLSHRLLLGSQQRRGRDLAAPCEDSGVRRIVPREGELFFELQFGDRARSRQRAESGYAACLATKERVVTQRKFIDDWKRTHYCGDLRGADIGEQVVLFGWVDGRRDLGGCVFVDLRDREGVTQVVFDASSEPVNAETDTAEMVRASYAIAEQLRSEWVIAIRGVVVSRGENANKKIPTGEIEVRVLQAEVFNRAETPPFEIVDKLDTREELRLQYRFLDLRRHRMQRTFRLRHRMNQCARAYLSEAGCLELETPVMVKYTPGGARNFLVPSRHSAGKFYALAESPQLFKQLFMVAGFDRYFQIVKCFRDEDFRLDRQPEFTQVDIEMSFVNQDDIFSLVEGLVFRVVKETCGIDLTEKYPEGRFPRMAYADSMSRFGNDKPDLRCGLEHADLTNIVIEHQGGGVPFFEDIAKRFADGTLRTDVPAEIVKAVRVPASAQLSRSDTDKLEALARSMGAKGLAKAKVAPDGMWTQSPMAKNVTPEMRVAINEAMGAEAGDLLLFQFGKASLAHTVLANLRVHLAKKLGLIPPVGHGGRFEFLWVIDPPMFDYDEDTDGWVAAHHAFTRPLDQHIALLEGDPAKVQCYRYDLVLNGFEIGGGSIRLHDPEVQQAVFRTLGIGAQEAEEKFGFLLKALRHGAPPHGGIALGWDRIAMLLAEAESLRDVIPFPKTQKGGDPMTEAPSAVAADQLADVHIRVLDEPSS